MVEGMPDLTEQELRTVAKWLEKNCDLFEVEANGLLETSQAVIDLVARADANDIELSALLQFAEAKRITIFEALAQLTDPRKAI